MSRTMEKYAQVYNETTCLNFGKHKGKDLFHTGSDKAFDVGYFVFCVQNVDFFCVELTLMTQICTALKTIISEDPTFMLSLNPDVIEDLIEINKAKYDDWGQILQETGRLPRKYQAQSSSDYYDHDYDYNYDYNRNSYGEYAGSYAQDVEGLSDEFINTVLGGEPDAYWNID